MMQVTFSDGSTKEYPEHTAVEVQLMTRRTHKKGFERIPGYPPEWIKTSTFRADILQPGMIIRAYPDRLTVKTVERQTSSPAKGGPD
jgi:hypothetical protein